MRNPLSRTGALAIMALLPFAALGQDAPMTGQQIQDTWAGKDLVGNAASGARLLMRLEKDGTATVAAGNMSDTGTWRPHESGYCATWVKIRKGEERCFTVIQSGSSYKVLNPDGSASGSITAIR